MARLMAYARAVFGTPAIAALALCTLAYGIAWVARYAWIEPEMYGTLCRSGEAPFWCPIRTGLIRITEVGGLGIASIVLALLGMLTGGRSARRVTLAAMATGGAGLILYNTTFAALGVLMAMLRTSRLVEGCTGETEAVSDATGNTSDFGAERAGER